MKIYFLVDREIFETIEVEKSYDYYGKTRTYKTQEYVNPQIVSPLEAFGLGSIVHTKYQQYFTTERSVRTALARIRHPNVYTWFKSENAHNLAIIELDLVTLEAKVLDS